MPSRLSQLIVAVLLLAVGACTATDDAAAVPDESSAAATTSTTSFSGDPVAFPFPDPPTATFDASTMRRLQSILDTAVNNGIPGISATVIVADRGVWTGVAGLADEANSVTADAQFGVGSITKTLIAAQMFKYAEDGLLDLDDPAADYLPADLDFDTNESTIRDLLSMHSGIPDPAIEEGPDPAREWTTREILASVPDSRKPFPNGRYFTYENANYILLGLIVESISGRPTADALRSDVLSDPESATIVYQPAERPEGPFALPFLGGEARTDILEAGGGYLPSMASVSAGGGSGCVASDSPALALWAYDLFGGRLVSEESLSAMVDFEDAGYGDGYGMGVFDLSTFGIDFGTPAVGNGGWDPGGYSATMVALPDRGAIVVVLANAAGSPERVVLPVAGELASIVG